MRMPKLLAAAALLLGLLLMPQAADAHAYISLPVARNVITSTNWK